MLSDELSFVEVGTSPSADTMPTRPPSPSSIAETLFTPDSADSWAGQESEAADDDTLIGASLQGTYEVIRLLGEGGMGRVYEARHARLPDKRFAVKVLRAELVETPHIRARFEREVEAIARIDHPGVLAIADVGVTPRGLPYMVCEHLRGLDLLAYLRRFGALPSEHVVRMGRAIAEALEETHARGLIHRDVKPSNVFLVGELGEHALDWERVKLIDFGLSRFVTRDDQLTKTGIVMGTPAYMSPEQAQGNRTDHLADVYGVGAVLYAAATGVPPFREGSPQQTLLAVMHRDPVRPREVRASISEGLEIVIQRAMAKEPRERYSSMSALRLALAKLKRDAARADGASGVEAGSENVRDVRLRFAGLSLAAALLSAAAIVLVASAFFPTADSSGARLSGAERVLGLVVLGLLLWMVARGLAKFGRGSWRNTAKLSARLPALRAPLVAALIAYGLGSLALRLSDQLLMPDAFAQLDRAPAQTWAGWSVGLVMLSCLAALAANVRQRWWRPTLLRRWLLGPALTAALIGVALAFAGWSSRLAREVEPIAPTAELSEVPVAAPPFEAPREPAAGAGVPASTATEPPSVDDLLPPAPDAGTTAAPEQSAPEAAAPGRAPAEALSAAVAAGAAELTKLAQSYDKDPAVLEALMLAHASRSSKLGEAVRALEALLQVAPEKARDPDVRYILIKAAGAEGSTSRHAFRVMSKGMGSAGPDLLYDLVLRKPALAERAAERLSWVSVRKRFSPELAVAYDLKFAPNCSARVRLLDRATRVGDQRSINVLSALISKPAKCGQRPRPPCVAPCERDAKVLSRAIDDIARRIRSRDRSTQINQTASQIATDP